jgi:hypothetical protein
MRRRAEHTASSKISTAKNSRIQFLIELQHRLTSEIYELLGQLGVDPTSAQESSVSLESEEVSSTLVTWVTGIMIGPP